MGRLARRAVGTSCESLKRLILVKVKPRLLIGGVTYERSRRRDQSTGRRAQYLRDNLPNLDDPPTTQQLTLIQAFIGTIQERLDRVRELTTLAAKR
jgi:hypothetical protein